MNRTVLAILLLFTLASLQGCGMEDPGQPAVGSISVGAKKSDDGPNLPLKKGTRPTQAK